MARPMTRRRVLEAGTAAVGMMLASPFARSSTGGSVAADDVPLRQLADQRQLLVGMESIEPVRRADVGFSSLLTTQFNMLATGGELLWQSDHPRTIPSFHPSRDTYDFSLFDAVVAFAEQNNMTVQAMHLIWHQFLPAWVTKGSFSAADGEAIVREAITTTMGRYQGKRIIWSVLNEFRKNQTNSPWYVMLGESLPDIAFDAARTADPNAVVMFNDCCGSEVLGPRSDYDFAVVKRLREKGLIDVFGIQMHVDAANPPDIESFRRNVQRFLDLGVRVHLTEFDVNVSGLQADGDTKQALQAKIFGDVTAAYLALGGMSICFWGGTDAITGLGPDAQPTLFDGNGNPKPAYFAVRDVLSQYAIGRMQPVSTPTSSGSAPTAVAAAAAFTPIAAFADTDRQRYFAATGHSLSVAFKTYWEQHGALAIFGYPISEPFQERNADDGKTYMVQYFERNRFEYHPENAGTPYEVLLGLLGKSVTATRTNEPPFQRVSAAPAGATVYPETGHSLGGKFKEYWDANGGLALFGYPISEPFQEQNAEDGKTYLVQYFERNRFELHPENAGTPYEVLLGQLGKQVARERGLIT